MSGTVFMGRAERRSPLGRGLDALLPKPDLAEEIRGIDLGDADSAARLVEIVGVIAEELERHVERTEGMSAEKMFARARGFMRENPSVWGRIKDDARSAAREGRRFSMKKEIEDLRDEGRIKTLEGDYKFNSSVTAALTRFLLHEVPEAEPYVAIRPSKVDKYFETGGKPIDEL